MKVGWMWQDNDPAKPVEQIVAEAAAVYRRKFRRTPNACYLNEAHDCAGQAGCVRIIRVPNIVLHHFWLGVERET